MKRFIPAVLVCVLAASAGYAQTSSQKAAMQYDMRDYELAIDSYEKALKSAPEDMDIPAKIARCYVQMQDYLSASQWYEKIVDEEDVNPEYILEYAHVLKSLRLYAKARFYYQRFAEHDRQLAEHFIYGCDIAKVEMQGDPFYEITPLPVNSASSEFAPFPVDNQLVFSSLRTDIAPAERKSRNGKTLDSKQTAFYASGTDMKTISPVTSGSDGKEVISHIRYSLDGKWVAFQKSDFREGQRLFDNRAAKISLYIGKVSGDGIWSDVVPFLHNGSDFATGYPSFSPDGSVLYFASTRPGGKGGWDLYVSFRGSGGWTTPQNLGDIVNTPGDEIAPYYTDHTLFFSSDWHPGIGGFDIFKAHSNDGMWSNVRSMGYPLNSPKDDIDFVWDNTHNTGYFASNRVGTTGAYDIFSCKPLYEEVIMTVFDQQGGNPIEGVSIAFSDNSSAPVITDKHGEVYIHQHFDKTTGVTLSREGYKNLEMTISPPGEGPARYEVFIDRSLAESEPTAVASNKSSDPLNAMLPKSRDQIKSEKRSASVSTEPVVETRTVVKQVVIGEPESQENPVSRVDKPAEKTAVSRPATTAAATVERNTAAPKPNVGMYAVQIAAVGQLTNLNKYSSLSTIGKVMQYPENGLYKVRVGYYEDETQAKNALRSIRNSGYPDAFVVRATPAETAVGQPQASGESYLVRLGAYSKPEYFEESAVSHLGDIVREKSGRFTIMLVGNYDSKDSARKALEGARKAGFQDAYIVDEDMQKVAL